MFLQCLGRKSALLILLQAHMVMVINKGDRMLPPTDTRVPPILVVVVALLVNHLTTRINHRHIILIVMVVEFWLSRRVGTVYYSTKSQVLSRFSVSSTNISLIFLLWIISISSIHMYAISMLSAVLLCS